MVKPDLNETMISAGADLIRHLEKVRFRVVAGFWLYLPDANRWRLVIASPEVRKKGPLFSYRKVQSTLRRVAGGTDVFSLGDIALLKDSDPLIASLRRVVATGRETRGVRFSQNAVNGHYIEDAYIYRVQ